MMPRRFTEEEIRKIRASKLSLRNLAKRYGVCHAAISKIIHFKTYKEIK
jgi:predicted transcriptional regulator